MVRASLVRFEVAGALPTPVRANRVLGTFVLLAKQELKTRGRRLPVQTICRFSNIGFCDHAELESVEGAIFLDKRRRDSAWCAARRPNERARPWDALRHIHCIARRPRIAARLIVLLALTVAHRQAVINRCATIRGSFPRNARG